MKFIFLSLLLLSSCGHRPNRNPDVSTEYKAAGIGKEQRSYQEFARSACVNSGFSSVEDYWVSTSYNGITMTYKDFDVWCKN